MNGLSPAQRRVLAALLEGNSEKDVAARLKLSPHTIHNHVREIYARFGVHSRPELMARCLLSRPQDDLADD
jgi:DNA-binding CsgD family transcriptional regulator